MESTIVRDCLVNLKDSFKSFVPCFTAADRKQWEQIPEALKEEALRYGYELKENLEWNQIFITDYLEFSRSGNRINFENKYFCRRNKLNTLVIAECIEYKGNFIDDILNGLYAIMEETAWYLPAHNSYIRDTKQLLLPDTSRPIIELFACETGALFSLTAYLLKDELDAISPQIIKQINQTLKERIIKPYMTEHFWWMGNGDEVLCNWTPWCTMNVLLTAGIMAQNDSSIDLKAIIEKSSYSLDCFLKDYGEDGCCNEGVQYYRAAGLCLFNAVEIMDKITDGAFSSLWQNQKIKNIANYVRNMHVDGKYYINFGDCSAVAGKSGVREYLFGKAINDSQLMAFASREWNDSSLCEKLREVDRFSTEGINLYYRVISLLFAKETADYAFNKNSCETENQYYKPIWYESVGVFIVRNKHFTLAVKAGSNGDSHNHNDSGSMTIYKDGKPYLIDLGVETYSAKTFSKDRYDIWTMQSSWHNLPEINGFMQKDGSEYCVSDVKIKSNENESSISFDICTAYPKEAECERYRRTVKLCDSGIELTDEFLGKGKAVLSLISENRSILENLGYSDCEIESVKITDARLHTTWKDSIYRKRIAFESGNLKIMLV